MWKLCSSGKQSNQIKINTFVEEIKVQQFHEHYYMWQISKTTGRNLTRNWTLSIQRLSDTAWRQDTF